MIVSPLENSTAVQSVLIVDDNDSVRAALRAFFRTRTDIRVVGEAADGTQAVSKAQRLAPDFILMDLAMPEMNGMEASSVIKASLPFTQIIMFTLYSDVLGTKLARAAGVDVILPKEAGTAGLIGAIERILAGKAPS